VYNTIFSENYPYYRDKFNKISDSYDDYYVSQLETKEEESEEDKVERLRYDHFESMADEKRKFKN
jgi:hypothetical protein